VTDQVLPDESGDLVTDEMESIKHAAYKARNEYVAVRSLYEDFARSLAAVLENCFSANQVSVHSVTFHAKDPASFERKACQPSSDDPTVPKYQDPIEEISDKAGVRIITYFLSTVDIVSRIIAEQFDVIEQVSKVSSEPDRLGYQSVHYLIKYSDARTTLPEYCSFSGLVAEIQVRTILQHAWAEIEHDIQYKAVGTLPSRVRRRFAALAGLIEIADREFQAIEDEDRAVREEEARRNVDLGQLDKVEITSDSLRAFLNRKYGADGRMSDSSYDWKVHLLQRLGFTNLAEVEECISSINDSVLSRMLHGARQSQLTRFELVLLASMGENYVFAHPWVDASDTDRNWHIPLELKRLDELRDAGVEIGNYRPPGYPETTLRASDLSTTIWDRQEEDPAGPSLSF